MTRNQLIKVVRINSKNTDCFLAIMDAVDAYLSASNGSKPIVSGWHFLPEMPEINKEVLVAVKYDNEPVQAFWTGKEWKGSFLVRDNMADGFVRDESYKHIQEWIYAWMELPQVPPIPEPF